MMRRPPKFYVPIDDRWSRNLTPAHQSEAGYLLNLIHWKRISWRADDDGFVRLKTAYLHRVIDPTVLTMLRSVLVDDGVLEFDPTYVKGYRSMRYRVPDGFRRTKPTVCFSSKVRRRI